jgi:hypothetical protein
VTKADAMNTPNSYSAEELARRRTSSRRLAWALGAAVLAIYIAGMLVQR